MFHRGKGSIQFSASAIGYEDPYLYVTSSILSYINGNMQALLSEGLVTHVKGMCWSQPFLLGSMHR